MANYQNKDFDRMMFPAHRVANNQQALKQFPQLAEYEEFQAEFPRGISKMAVIRYIIFCYDRNSPLMRETDIRERKELAANHAELTRTPAGNLTAESLTITKCSNPESTNMIVRYIRMQNDLRFGQYITLLENFYQMQIILTSNHEGLTSAEHFKFRREMTEELDTTAKKINHLYDQIFLDKDLSEPVLRYVDGIIGKTPGYAEIVASDPDILFRDEPDE